MILHSGGVGDMYHLYCRRPVIVIVIRNTIWSVADRTPSVILLKWYASPDAIDQILLSYQCLGLHMSLVLLTGLYMKGLPIMTRSIFPSRTSCSPSWTE